MATRTPNLNTNATASRTAPTPAPQNRAGDPAQDKATNNRITNIDEWLRSGVVLPSLKDGAYQARLVAFTPVTTDPDQSKWYVRLEWQLPDRIIVDNRFLSGIQVMASQLADIRPDFAGLNGFSFLQSLLATTSMPIFISHNTAANGQTYRNINFRAPATTDTQDAGEVPAF